MVPENIRSGGSLAGLRVVPGFTFTAVLRHEGPISAGLVAVTPPVAVIQGGTGVPTDPDTDGKYDDVKGNGRIDFADVVWLFNHL